MNINQVKEKFINHIGEYDFFKLNSYDLLNVAKIIEIIDNMEKPSLNETLANVYKYNNGFGNFNNCCCTANENKETEVK